MKRQGKVLAGRFSRAERKRQRRSIDLEDASLTDQTRTRYYLALRKLMPSLNQIETFDILDEKVCIWIQRMWKQGEPLLTIGDALSALHFFQPSTKRQIPHAWKLFATWRKLEVPARAPPLTAVLVRGMSALALNRGQLELATCLILGFHALLRTGELLTLRGTDFLVGKTHALLRLELTKTGRRRAVSEAISIQDEIVLLLLTTLLQVRKDKGCLEAFLWTQSHQAFRQNFKKLCHDFGLDHLQFRPYSLRRGGATDFFQRTLSMEATLLRGRWESSRVARLYINDGLSFLPTLKTTPKMSKMLAKHHFISPSQG